MKRTWQFKIYVKGTGEIFEEAWQDAVKNDPGFDNFDECYEVCEVCGFPLDVPDEDCMCDDAVAGDTVGVMDDPMEYRYVCNKGDEGWENNTETPESVRELRNKGLIRFKEEFD